MSPTFRRLAILGSLAVIVLLLAPTSHAAAVQSPRAAATDTRPQAGTPEAILLDAANHDRTAAGLPSMKWDKSLAASALAHAKLMAQNNTLSHQLPGEPSLEQRAVKAGVSYTVLAENIAQGPTVAGLHFQWMNSPPHRANLMATDMSAIGIAVVQSGNTLFAVEDFSQPASAMNLDTPELWANDLGLRFFEESVDNLS
jgi:uncharacterized protein YkwD